jgi:4-amino-4-deoxy-L-arabinose transferase-like glycosyltransferase
MPEHAPTTPQTTPSRVQEWGALILIIVVALALRVVDLGGFVIEDEARYWLDRSYQFLKALDRGDYAATAISTHPGVTTMWSGSLGTMLKRTLLEWGWLDAAPFPTTLALMRLPAALVHTAAVLVGYALMRRMFPFMLAVLATLLWATDPLTLAFSRVLHVDGLAGTFLTLSILAACAYWHHRPRLGLLVLSGACGALATLSKSPGLIILAVVPAIALYNALFPLAASEETGATASRLTPHASRVSRLASRLAPLLAWGLAFALTIVAAWPAVWADPLRVYELLRIGVEVEGGSPHVQGNYFLGQQNDEPGWRFYPVALALRLTPWAMLGLFALALLWRVAPASKASKRDLLMLAGFAVLFLVALSIFPKKLNRYIMPAFPALMILAAAGLYWAVALLARGRERIQQALLLGVALLAWLNAAWWHPYSIAYFNPLLGGAQAGPYAFLIGHGEGLEQAAAWLNEQPDITGVVVASTMTPPLQPYLRHGAQSFPRQGDALPDQTGYVVVYVRNVWGGGYPPFDQFYPQATPLHTVTIHGVEYAWIYQVPPPIENRLDARFGERIALRGYELHTAALTSTNTLSFTVQWKADAPPQHDYLMFAHLLNGQGERVAQIDVPPGGPDQPASQWEPGRVITWVHPLPLPPDLPPGDYWLALGLYRPDDFARLPLHGADPPPAAPDAGPGALLLPVPEVPE